jgi:hypothetical protein
VESTDHEGRGKNLRVCYCDKVQCIRLCCPPGGSGPDCEPHPDENFGIYKKIHYGQHGTGLVNLKDEAYMHRLVYGNMCHSKYVEKEGDDFELLSVSLLPVCEFEIHLKYYFFRMDDSL